MKICTGCTPPPPPPVQVHVAPSSSIIVHSSVNLGQGFLLISAEEKAKYISVI